MPPTESPISIVGKWKTFWSNRPEAQFSETDPPIEYTALGEYIELSTWPDGKTHTIRFKCEYEEGRVRHLLPPDRVRELNYVIEGDILTITDAGAWVWKLKRVTE